MDWTHMYNILDVYHLIYPCIVNIYFQFIQISIRTCIMHTINFDIILLTEKRNPASPGLCMEFAPNLYYTHIYTYTCTIFVWIYLFKNQNYTDVVTLSWIGYKFSAQYLPQLPRNVRLADGFQRAMQWWSAISKKTWQNE